jgi:hypothetical protein
MNIEIPDFGADIDQLHNWFKANKDLLIRQKKMSTKWANACGISIPKDVYIKPDASKELGIVSVDTKNLIVKAAQNSTNIIDSHMDLHLPKGWNRSVKHQVNNGLHLKEHKMSFDNVLADGAGQVKLYVTTMSWKSLGYEYEGKCDVLMHESTLLAYPQPLPHQLTKAEMFYRYRDGEVKYHSVGMGYGETFFCLNSDEKYWKEEKDNYQKYIEMAVNPEVANERGYFYAVGEMKYMEGSAVVRASNTVTPTISVIEQKEELESAKSTSITIPDPSNDTQKQSNIIKKLKF